MDWFTLALKKFAVFNGRSRRREYWMFFLFCVIVIFFATILDNAFGITFNVAEENSGFGPIYLFSSLVLFIPTLAVSVRRLHDIDKSGLFVFVIIIPLIGAIWFLVMMITEGTKGTNQYGPDPKSDESVL
jgi:uncharacterized membrane protein YhaH (DUF805 family)